MRPTLYADDLGLVLPQALSDESVERLSEFLLRTMEPLRRILPLRCRWEHTLGPGRCTGDPDCDGRGWLYPDPPDWWEDLIMNDEILRREYTEERRRDMLDDMTEAWHKQLRNVWRVMGILEED